ncbi:MAG TPA: hypothetical protein VM686_22370 [Polyangiaceae bacterium]|nr:hypothetical protein [Polyangiaceae bacterium]
MPRLAALLLLPLGCTRGSGEETRSDAVPPRPSSTPAVASLAGPAPVAEKPPAPSPKSRPSPEPAGSGQAFTAGIVEYRPKPKEVALLTDVRSARHEGFDRIVFEFASGPLPGYHLEYVDKPVRRCGSGEATPVAGDAWLEVRFEPANAHTPSGAPTIKDRDQKLELEVVKELEQTCDFEAHVTWVLGAAKPNKYRVLTLDDPLRLVVDVKH